MGGGINLQRQLLTMYQSCEKVSDKLKNKRKGHTND